MVFSMRAPALLVRLEPLTQQAYAPFGTVVESKVGPLRPEGSPLPELPEGTVVANQGTAVKQLDVTRMTDYYALAPSGQPSKAVVNMFSCAPRALRLQGAGDQNLRFDVSILERHPFTSQTFVPLGVTAEDKARCYLVIVAPTAEQGNASSHPHQRIPAPPRGSGPPDLKNLCAFVATGAQAVTYAAGTWHAPMVVLGTQSIDFVVMQFANGVGDDDCQEVQLVPEREGSPGVSVEIAAPEGAKTGSGSEPRSKL